MIEGFFNLSQAEHCPQRQVQCEYCEMDMDFKNMTEHKDFCGSRTDPCPLCNRYIFFRDKALHEDSNCQYPKVKPTKSNPNPMGSSLPSKQWQRNPFMFGLPEASGTNQFPPGLFGQFPVAPLGRTQDTVEERKDVFPREMRRTFSEGMTGDRKHRKNQDRIQNIMAKSVTRPREKNGKILVRTAEHLVCFMRPSQGTLWKVMLLVTGKVQHWLWPAHKITKCEVGNPENGFCLKNKNLHLPNLFL